MAAITHAEYADAVGLLGRSYVLQSQKMVEVGYIGMLKENSQT